MSWVATGDVIGYLHQVNRVVSGSDLTFFFDSGGNVISEMFTSLIAFVQL